MKKTVKVIISVVLCIACIIQPCTAAAATFTGKTYIKEMIISYGKTEDEAKSWLTNKGYKVLDNNLNEGADDTWSTKRAVYLGYKTTLNADEAITDMKLMNMNGGYSVEDYQILLEDQKSNIKVFLDNFKVAIKEYRENYKNGQERAVAAHDMLNLLYDDDTEETLGDLFLEKIKEEYTDDEWAALSKDKQEKTADMTTILMQANATSVLAIEQLIAPATDDSNSVWTDRYASAKTYDEMVSDLVENKKMSITQAVKKLATDYDSYAGVIASKIEDYKTYLATYTDEDIRLTDSSEKILAYKEANEKFNISAWTSAGTQYGVLESLKNDDISLLELLTSDDYDLEGEDRCLLYPLVSVLTDGQKACLDFLPMYQIVAIGINDDSSMKTAMDNIDVESLSKEDISIYYGVDRSIFSSKVALTGDAYKLESSSTAHSSDNWFNSGLSPASRVLVIALGVSIAASVASLITGFAFSNKALNAAREFAHKVEPKINFYTSELNLERKVQILTPNPEAYESATEFEAVSDRIYEQVDEADPVFGAQMKGYSALGSKRLWSKIFTYAGVTLTVVTFILSVYTLYRTVQELKEYYHTEFSPIPMHMVDQSVDGNGKKVFTYYTAVKCNREEAQMVTDNTKILEGFGDLNGDVGKQWVALYTTKDKAAGNPITANLVVQYNDTKIPDDKTALSMFCESTAQNLTNKKSGYTYADGKSGIYLFYGTDSTVFAGSLFSNGTYAMFSGGVMIVFGFVSYFISKNIRKKKTRNTEVKAHA